MRTKMNKLLVKVSIRIGCKLQVVQEASLNGPEFSGSRSTNAGRKRAHPFVRWFVQIPCRNTENQTRQRPLRGALCGVQVREKPLSFPCFSAKLSDGQSEKVVQIIRIASVFRLTPICAAFPPH